jgi:NitT/TauT family transport system substrate-binding protein
VKRRLLLRRAFAAAAVLSAAPAGLGAQAYKLRIGSQPGEASADVFYAADMGYFERVKLPFEISILKNGAATAAAVAGGSLDVGEGSVFTFMNAVRHGLPYTMIAPGSIYDSNAPTNLLMAAANSSIRSAKDLNGKIVGGQITGALDQLTILAWVDQNGGDAKTVKVVEISLAAMAEALELGRIDAANMQEPYIGAAGSRLRVLGKSYDAVAKQFMASAWFTTKTFAAKEPDLVRRFADGVTQAAAWAGANPEKAAAILEKWTSVKEPRIHTRNALRLDAALVQPVCDAALKYKMIDAPLDAKEFFWANRSPSI